MPQPQFDRAAQDIGNIVGIGHVNVCIDRPAPGARISTSPGSATRATRSSTPARGNMWVNVGMSQFHLPMGKPDVLRGIDRPRDAGPRGAAPAAHAGEEARSTAPGSRSARPMTASRPSARGATASPCTSPTRPLRPHPARHALCPLRRAPRHRGAHRALLPRDVRRPGEVDQERHGPQAEVQVGEQPVLLFPRDRRAGSALRPAPRADLSCQFLRTVSQAARSRPDHRSRTTTTSIASRTSSTSTPAKCCSRSSTRRAARPTRCTAGR